MRKIVYSGFLKLVAVILLIASIVCGLLVLTDCAVDYSNEEEEIYSFEDDFSQSWYVKSLLASFENLLFDAYYDAYYEYDEDKHSYSVKDDVSFNDVRAELANSLKESFGDFSNFEKINYYVRWNDLVFTNCGAKSAEELMQGEFYSYVKRDGVKALERKSSVDKYPINDYVFSTIERLDSASKIEIAYNIKNEAASEYKAIWERQETIVYGTIIRVLVCLSVALLSLFYLLCVCGKNKDGEYKNMWLDHIWLEIHLAAIAGAGVGAAALFCWVLDSYMWDDFPYKLLHLSVGCVSALAMVIITTSLLSIIRNIKTRRLLETSIIFLIVRWTVRLIIRILKWLWRVTKSFWTTVCRLFSIKAGVLYIGMLLIYTILIVLLTVGTIYSPVWLFIGIMLLGFACFVLARRASDIDRIKNGARQVRNGNVSYKIPELKFEDMKKLAENINDIAKGLDESVSAQVKAERLKSELITNVSHDLKTPITSIISYTELLSKIDGLPEEAKDYVAVIAKKSDRLKKLTQDLFDISKVQSGNESITLEKLDVSLLINQALAEQDNEIQSSGLPFCVDAPKELYIFADGRKMSRVVNNLINNILKYTLKNTRVFITAKEKNDNIEIEFKNISAYPLDFNVDEITQRFVRGDESRTAEGNGLGLAIAKSYTEICNGTFEIITDGDMFKAILKFKKYI